MKGKTFYRLGKASFRALGLFALAVGSAVVGTPPIAAGGERLPRICLAGTFNGWSPSEADYQLAEKDGRWELMRFWPCGGYRFKFVFDGSWAQHFGDAGGGRLGQPGRDIPLRIEQSGEYAVVLDLTHRRWHLEKRPASRPHALFSTRPVTHDRIRLDPSLSIARPGHPIRSFRWKIHAQDQRDDAWRLDKTESGALLLVDRPGQFDLTLTVDDGEDQASTTHSEHLGEGYELHVQDEPGLTGRLMYPLDGGTWGAIYRTPLDGPQRFLVRGHDVREDHPPVRTFRLEAGQAFLIRYDPSAKKITRRADGWHRFALRIVPDLDLPKGLRVERVEVVGDFNGWQAGRSPLRATGRDNYETVLDLADGIYQYKFLVNGCIYLEDPAADKRFRRPDGTGEYNSGFLVGPDARGLGPARPNDIVAAAVKHDPGRSDYFQPIAAGLVRLAVRTLADDVESVGLLLGGIGSPVSMLRMRQQSTGWKPVPQSTSRKSAPQRTGFDRWVAQVQADGPVLDYGFVIQDGSKRLVLDAGGLRDRPGAARQPFRQRIKMSFETPDWAKTAVWYQIFPERFCNGESSNDPPRTVRWTHKWYKPYRPGKGVAKGSPGDFVERGGFNRFIYNRRYGGDVQGIARKLPYLRDLGITAIYLNPIFLAESLHKYDTSDYRHIDDFFGVRDSLKRIRGETADPATWQWSQSDRVFLDFLKEAHRLGFRVIIDGVFNHVGRGFWAFRDVLKHGKNSPYAGWFDVTSWKPFHYKAWDRDDGALPRLKHDEALGLCQPVREHLFAITRRWMDPDGDGDPADGIDGWRLDVASDINANFWRDWRKLVKSINPQALIVAELWQESRPWLDGRTFDAVMNYPFAGRCQKFFVNQSKATKPSGFGRELSEMLGWYPPQVNYVLQNLFDSHDTDRAASMFMNPDLPYDKANRLQDNGPKYNPAKPTPDCYEKLRLMVTFQMTFLGTPMVYYGDEVGMYGADDPSNRKPMLWAELMPYDDPEERIETEVIDHYRRMIALRRSYPALQLGLFQPLLADDAKRIFAFARTLGDQSIVVVLNNGDKARRLDVPVPWSDGTAVVRLDDPQACRLVQPPQGDLTSRPTLQPVRNHHSKLRIEDGHLKGGRLEPRSGGVFWGSLRRVEKAPAP